ncbi:MAG TPA: class I SAM-dependent methyltransferase [Streptosporangiaceae bacterium]|nr:class I SAM-dependent methyltransferase [Streptosporangiaceae bacterium]
MATYDRLAGHYDAVTGDSAAEIMFIDRLIQQANPEAATLLEVACGTGGVMAPLAGSYQVSGLDVSPGMLAVARKKLPAGTPLYEADMSCFKLDAQFDAIICIYHSINHLLGFAAWQSFFDCVCSHLNQGGVFIFDINTLRGLKLMASMDREVQQFGDNYLIIRVRTSDQVVFNWNIDLYELQHNGRYRLVTQVIRTASFPVAQIRAALRERFAEVRTIGGEGSAGIEDGVTADSVTEGGITEGGVTEGGVIGDGADRAWFVCTKAASAVRP